MLFTVGHGRWDRRQLAELLTGAGVRALVDVRRFPASRTNSDVSREELLHWLPEVGIGCRWEQRLGGRRRLPAGEVCLDAWWTVPAFCAYATYTRTLEFGSALDELMAEANAARLVIMCGESVWWRCHRRLIADVVTLTRGRAVWHVMPDGRLTEHRVAAGARVADIGVMWDGVRSPVAADVDQRA